MAVDHTGLDSGREGGWVQTVVVWGRETNSHRSRVDEAKRPVVQVRGEGSGGTEGREGSAVGEESVRRRPGAGSKEEWWLVREEGRLGLQVSESLRERSW